MNDWKLLEDLVFLMRRLLCPPGILLPSFGYIATGQAGGRIRHHCSVNTNNQALLRVTAWI